MTLFNDYFLYASLGIALFGSSSAEASQTSIQKDEESFYVGVKYSQPTSQLNVTVYSINKESFLQPKRDFRLLYASITESQWFARAYRGKSLGDFIEIDY